MPIQQAISTGGTDYANDTQPFRRSSSLLAARAGLAKRASTPFAVVCIGDSITETATAQRWASLIGPMLRNRYQVATGGEGYVPVYYGAGNGAGGVIDRWSHGGSLTLGTEYGLGRKHVQLDAGDTETLVFTGTGLDLCYAKGPGQGIANYTIDGGSATQFDTSAGAFTDTGVTQIRGLSAASHAIAVSYVSGGSVLFEGAYVYNGDEAAGIHIWDCSHSGYRADQFNSGANSNAWISRLGVINPSLVVVGLTMNDGGQLISAATYETAINSLVSTVNAQVTPDPSVVLVGGYPGANFSGGALAAHALHLVSLQKIAAQNGYAYHDLQARFGDPTIAMNTYGLIGADSTHPTNGGHQFIADALLHYLTG